MNNREKLLRHTLTYDVAYELVALLRESNIQSRLEQHGPPQSLDGGGIYSRVFVGEEDYEDACRIAEELANDITQMPLPPDGPSFCPKCDGENFNERVKLGFLGFFQRNVYCCADCGFEWKPS